MPSAWSRQLLLGAGGADLARLAATFTRIGELPATTAQPAHPFLFCLTVDAEAGYLRPDLSCVWSDVEPRALHGFRAGIPAALAIARDARAPTTFLASTQGFIARAGERREVQMAFERALGDGHELGLHLHPRTDETLHAALGRRLASASAHFYDEPEQREMLLASRALVREHLGADGEASMHSFRWGNWALATPSVRALERTGFDIDSTALPGKRDHHGTDRFYDWSRVRRRDPFRLCRADYQDTVAQDSTVLELPVATFDLFGARVADAALGALVEHVLLRYHAAADRSREPFVFVVSAHSPELVFADGSRAPTVAAVERLLSRASSLADLRFATLREAARLVRAARANGHAS